MNFLGTIVILAQMASPPNCSFDEPYAPQSSPAVQEIFTSEGTTREVAERALQKSLSSGDAVGEAQADFILARVAFEADGKWPAEYIKRSSEACDRGGCGPEIMKALFSWADAVGPGNASFQPALDTAFAIAEHERQRPRAAADELRWGAAKLEERHKLADSARQSRELAEKILALEAAAGAQAKDAVREATFENALGALYRSEKALDSAAGAYAKAATAWEEAFCRSSQVDSLMAWARVLHDTGTKQAETAAVLGRAVAAAEKDELHSSDLDWALSDYSYRTLWKDATPDVRTRYLRVRQKLLKGFRSNPYYVEDLANEAESLGDLEFAAELNTELLNGASGYEKKHYLESLARIADKRGKKVEAATYRKEAEQVPIPQNKYGHAAAGNAKAAAAARGSGSPPSKRPPPPWSPPTIEHPGSEGGNSRPQTQATQWSRR